MKGYPFAQRLKHANARLVEVDGCYLRARQLGEHSSLRRFSSSIARSRTPNLRAALTSSSMWLGSKVTISLRSRYIELYKVVVR